MADHLAHLVLRIAALVGRNAGTGADFVEVIERFVLPGGAVVLVQGLGVIEVDLAQADDGERHVEHTRRLAGLLVAAVIQREVLAHGESRGVLVARGAAVAAQPRVPEIDHAVTVGILVAVGLVLIGVRQALVGEVNRGIEPRLAVDEHPERIGDGAVAGFGRELLGGEPLFERAARAAVGHEEIVDHADGQRIAAVPAVPARRQGAHAVPLHRVGVPPDDLGILAGAPGGRHGAEVIHDLIERSVCGRFEQLVFGHVDDRLGGIGGILPQLLVIGLGHEHRAVVIRPVLVGRIAVEERAGDHQQHARLDGPGGTDGGEPQREFLVAGGGHTVFTGPVDLAVDPADAFAERVARLRSPDLVGRTAGLHDGDRAVEAQQQVVVIGTHEAGFGTHRAAVDLAQFGALVHVFEEQVAVADGLVVTHEEIEVVGTRVTVVVVGAHLPLGDIAHVRFENVGRFVGAPEIGNLAAVMHLLHHEIVAVNAVVPLGGLDLGREDLVHRVQVFGILIQIVGAAGKQKERREH